MPQTLVQLPSKRQFYNKLNEFVEEAYHDIIAKLPRAGQNVYRRRVATGTGNVLPRANSGRLLGSIVKPGRIHVRGFADGVAKAGKLTFVVRNEQLYDPINKEHYWSKIAYNAKTDFGNTNHYRNFWTGASKQLRGKIKTYASQYATYKYKDKGMTGLEDYEKHFLNALRDYEYEELYEQAMEENAFYEEE